MDPFEEVMKYKIGDVYFTPKLKDNRNWTFWQFTDKVRLNGYDGKEKRIDVNVFNGTAEDFDKLLLKCN